MSFEFATFPWSYRASQTLMSVTLLLLASTAFGLLGKLPPVGRVVVLAGLGMVIVVSFLLSAYVVVRYPYLSLVGASDGDLFDRQVGSNLGWLTSVLKVLGLLFLVMAVVLIARRGFVSPAAVLFFVYALVMIPVLLFLFFWYRPASHPTVATLIRSTFGVGLLLFPLFLPFVIIGSFRCQRLLDEFGPDQPGGLAADDRLT
ncbi:hypothetical protein [Lignipirellula cremea]|uniref:Uncharacterized protein n=1 Tax=Lignipirellula cremea TaxID=2528010 RepID=A0A518DZY9_9BACT|nr:hypothetical protein [Lignipirellula cremea]QDU97381.1 hypothetical protein Pla8534_52270 [Lignipirellula cremea]